MMKGKTYIALTALSGVLASAAPMSAAAPLPPNATEKHAPNKTAKNAPSKLDSALLQAAEQDDAAQAAFF
jgi:hypothetical protein